MSSSREVKEEGKFQININLTAFIVRDQHRGASLGRSVWNLSSWLLGERSRQERFREKRIMRRVGKANIRQYHEKKHGTLNSFEEKLISLLRLIQWKLISVHKCNGNGSDQLWTMRLIAWNCTHWAFNKLFRTFRRKCVNLYTRLSQHNKRLSQLSKACSRMHSIGYYIIWMAYQHIISFSDYVTAR